MPLFWAKCPQRLGALRGRRKLTASFNPSLGVLHMNRNENFGKLRAGYLFPEVRDPQPQRRQEH